ncbi:MAG: hypothetical protein ACXAAH_06585 [Promethearchaeota archaeon]|jgi:hypothetical protein
MNNQIDLSKYKDQMNQIHVYAVENGYDLSKLDKEMLNSIMLNWIKSGKDLIEKIEGLSMTEKKTIFKINI